MISRGESSFSIAYRKLGPRFTWQRLSLELADSPTLARLKWNSSTFCCTLSLHSVPAQFRAISFLFLRLRALWSSWFLSLSYVPHTSISKPFWSTFSMHQDPHLLPISSASTVPPYATGFLEESPHWSLPCPRLSSLTAESDHDHLQAYNPPRSPIFSPGQSSHHRLCGFRQCCPLLRLRPSSTPLHPVPS